MKKNNRATITKKLLENYGDSINTRGIIIIPKTDNDRSGTVHFNIMDTNHPDYGRNMRKYFIDKSGKIEII